MPDVHIPPEPENAIGRKVREWAGTADELFREAVTGQPAGRLRRPILFVIAAVGILLAPFFGIGPAIAGLIAILLLALTDQVVEL